MASCFHCPFESAERPVLKIEDDLLMWAYRCGFVNDLSVEIALTFFRNFFDLHSPRLNTARENVNTAITQLFIPVLPEAIVKICFLVFKN